MASFTDNAQALSQFNPYIQQVPVDDYIRVGLEKQQQYEQGVQRTQANIDAVTSLPIMKQEQKDYLGERINQLKTSISRVVGQDFSSSQLVNQIGGLTSQVANDPIIQTGVQSTHRYQAEASRMDEARKAGKSNVANEFVFENGVQKWLNDGQLKSSYTGSYTPYTDVTAKALKAINDLHPSETLQQLPFQMKDGQVVKVNGVPQIDAVMIQKMTKSLDAKTIATALQGAMGPDEMNQLAIDGQYEYRGYTPDNLKEVAKASYSHEIGRIDEIVKGLAAQKLTNTSDKSYQDGLTDQINQYQLQKQTLLQKLPHDLKFAEQDPDTYKGELYKQNWLSNMSNGYAYATNSLTYMDNPYEKDRLARSKEAREAAIFNAEYGPNGLKNQQLDIERARLMLDQEKLSLTKKGKLDANGNPVGPSLFAPVEGNVSAQHVGPQPTIDSFNAETHAMEVASDGAMRQAAVSLFNGRQDIPNQMAIDPVTGVITYKDEKAKAYVQTTMAKLKDDWIKDPSSVSTAAATYFQSFDDINNRIANRNKRVSEIMNAANSIFDPSAVFGKISGVTISGAGLSNTGVSGGQLADFARRLNTVISSPPGGGNAYIDEQKANQIFTSPVDRVLYNTYKKGFYQGNTVGFGSSDITPSQQLILNKISQARGIVNQYSKQIGARDEYANKAAANLVQAEIPASFPINIGKEDAKRKALGLINSRLGYYKEQGAGELPGGTTVKNVNELMKSPLTTYALEAIGNNQFNIRLSSSGVDVPDAVIPLRQSDINNWFPEANINQFAAVKEALALSKYAENGHTTDICGNGATSAFILRNPNVNRYAVKYHVEEPYSKGQYQVKAFVMDKTAKQAPNQPPVYLPIDVPLPSLLGEEGLANFINNFGDDDIQRLLTQQYKNSK